jgi:hypothetical protein
MHFKALNPQKDTFSVQEEHKGPLQGQHPAGQEDCPPGFADVLLRPAEKEPAGTFKIQDLYPHVNGDGIHPENNK